MKPGAILAVATALVCLGVALQVGLRRENPRIANGVIAVFVSLAIWAFGSAMPGLLPASEWQAAARRVIFLGTFTTPSLWLLLALHHAVPRRVRGRTGVTVALVTPSALFYLAALTNASHGWIIRPDAELAPRVGAWAGPLTWLFVVLASGALLAGTALFARTARHLWRAGRRRAGGTLALALTLPVASVVVTLAGAAPAGYAIVPASMTVSMIAVVATALRNPLAESPPLGHREVIDHLRHGVVIANGSGEILDHNAAATRIANAPLRERLFADALVEIVARAERPRLREALSDLTGVREARVLELETPDARSVEIRAFPVRHDPEQPLGLIAVLRDRTEERRYAEVVRRTQKLETVGTLAAGIAHEVNNPLAFVRANLAEVLRFGERIEERLADGEAGASKLAEALAELGELARDALDGIDRIERAIADVRRLSAAPTEGLARVDPNEIVREAVRLAELRGAGAIRVETDLAPTLPTVQGSPQLLVQALLNLLVNAQQAVEGRADGRVRVATGVAAGAVWIDVADDGPGVAPEHATRIFEPFYTSRSERGARGLGLSIAGDVARDHGGELRLEATERGALFRLRLPAAPAGAHRADAED